MSVKSFPEVFSKLSLSSFVTTNLKDTNVIKIIFNKAEKVMTIFLESKEVINEECLKDFKKDILKSFPDLNDAKIELKYDFENLELNLENIIYEVWINILLSIKDISPACFYTVKNSKIEIDGNNINIVLGIMSSFVFKVKEIDKQIQNILRKRLNKDFKINFIKSETMKYNKENNEFLENNLKDNINYKNKEKTKEFMAENTNDNSKFIKRNKLKIEEINEEISLIKNCLIDGNKVTISGEIFNFEIVETKNSKYILKVDLTDKTYSLSFKFFTTPKEFKEKFKNLIKKNNFVIVQGIIEYDSYAKDLILMANKISQIKPPKVRTDNATEKRVELHLHTQMSKMDGISSVKSLITRAANWGHKAIAITDHGVVQAYPDAMEVSKKLGIKVIYGLEAYLVDDLLDIVENSKCEDLKGSFVVFDIETTGLNSEYNKIIEIGAVKIVNGKIVDRFSSFINPNEKLTEKIIELTKITDEMLKTAPDEQEVLPKFFDFFKDSVLVAHNAKFDMSFIKKWAKRNNFSIPNTVLDTLGLSRTLFPEMSKHNLATLVKKLGITLENHHRAVDDANATAQIFLKFIDIMKEKNILNLDNINELAKKSIDFKKLRPTHAIILVKNQKGLKSLYELVSISHLNYFFKIPRIPKSELIRLKENLIIGTACSSGEFFQAVLNNSDEEELEKIAQLYDYFEVQPISNIKHYIKDERVSNINSEEDLRNINKKIVEYGKIFNKKVVATGDVHFLDIEDACFRSIIQSSQGFKDFNEQPELYFKTTEEMLEEFSYLGEKKAYEIVVKNTNYIADLIENVLPIPDGTFPPEIDGADKELKELTINKAKSIYGDNLPKIVEDRLNKELNSIINNGFAVLYIIAKKIVWHSNDNGYIVGSRGSVGSSLVATMAGITEVNPLSPHYFCKNCKFSDFSSEEVLKYAGNSGWDLPDKNCPNCNTKLSKDGHDIPFETFLGFNGDKEPDIDLNFSGEFQQEAHQYTEELFGKGFVFKAGTIGTLADKTAFGFVKKYAEKNELTLNSAEMNRLINGCVGIKRTTGQHPGGLMIVPNNKSIYDFCPVQRPADDTDSNVITTHFDYHSISGRILKLDLLGHDVPTILRMFKEFTNFDPLNVPMDDKKTMSLFTSPNILGLTDKDIDCKTGSLGLPEFGTPFVIQMLLDTKPTTFSELVRISGLSHGTDVWFNNAQELIKNKIATLKEVIPTRDDIMVYLILKGLENKLAFTIMESVRKGNGLKEEHEKAMIENNVPKWYIESCKKIKYMFPKGHAVAYVTNAFRIGYFKINYPEAFYASIFSVKVEDFDYNTMCFGIEKVKEAINQINSLGKSATAKDRSKLTILELVREMYARGLKFAPLDLYKSKAFKFDITENGILPPLCTVQGLGDNASLKIVSARDTFGEFETIEILVERTKLSKTVIEVLKETGVLKGIPDTSQLSLF